MVMELSDQTLRVSGIPTLSYNHSAARPSHSLPKRIVNFIWENNYLNSDLSSVGLDYMRPVIFCPHVFNSPRQPTTAKTANAVSERGILIFRLSHTDSLLHQPKVFPWNLFLLLFTQNDDLPTADSDD